MSEQNSKVQRKSPKSTKVISKPLIKATTKSISQATTSPVKSPAQKYVPSIQQYVSYSIVIGAWKDSLCRNDAKASKWYDSTFKSFESAITIYESNLHTREKYPQLYVSLSQLEKYKSSLIAIGVKKEIVQDSFKTEWITNQSAMGQGVKKAVFSSGQELADRHSKLSNALLNKVESVNSSRESSPRIPISKLSIKGTATSSLNSTLNSTPTSSGSNSPLINRISLPSTTINSSLSASSFDSQSMPAFKAYSKRSNSLLEMLPPTPSTSHESSPEPSLKKAKVKVEQTPEAIEAKEQIAMVSRYEDLEICRNLYEEAFKNGGAAFLALDIETWERQHGALLEFGWSFVDCEKAAEGDLIQVRREDQHIIIKENLGRRNGRFSPDARDHFDFGKSIILSEIRLYNLLHALLETLSSSTPLFLLFHDHRSDLKSLAQLGFETETFVQGGLHKLRSTDPNIRNQIYVVDTQYLFSAWIKKHRQVRLSVCCETLEVPTARLHNAGNDARFTLTCFESMMDRSRIAPSWEDLPPIRKD